MSELPQHFDRSKFGIQNYDPIDPASGRIRSLREMMEPQQRAARAAQIATALAKQKTEAAKSETQKRIDQAEAAHADARFQGDKQRMAMWRDHLESLKGKLADEQAQAEKVKLFDANPQIKLIRQTVGVDSLAHLFPASDRAEIETLYAISQSNDYPTPESLIADYSYHYDQLHSHNLKVERQREADLAESAAKATVEHANAAVRLAKLEQAKGGPSE